MVRTVASSKTPLGINRRTDKGATRPPRARTRQSQDVILADEIWTGAAHLAGSLSDIFRSGRSIMDQHDQRLLQKQLRAINSAPQQSGVIIVTALMVFLAGISLGSLLAAGPTSVAATDVAPAMLYPGGTQLTMR